ncbi:MAG: glycosyltransferase family 1 protein [bacterium]|nr:glycosyltransferase family 1 protein [bacterium]
MKIAIDARFYGPKDTGIGRYVSRLVENLQVVDDENEYLILMQEKDFPKLPDSPRFQKVAANFGWYGIKEQVLLPLILWRIKPDLVHFPHFNVPLLYFGKYVVTIHDLVKHEWHQQSSTTKSPLIYFLKHQVYKVVMGLAVRRATKIIVPSLFVKQKLISYFHLNPDKIAVTYEAGSLAEEASLSEEERKKALTSGKYNLPKPFILYVGNAYPYKNLPTLFAAVKLVNEKRPLQLAVVGARGVFLDRLRKEAEEQGSLPFLNFLGYVSDSDLANLYQEATAFVLPSFSEGFGLTVVEAMGLSCPVIAANASCLPEVCDDAALYFNPWEPKDLAEKILQVLDDSFLANDLREKGRKRFATFSWKKMAEETLIVYKGLTL